MEYLYSIQRIKRWDSQNRPFVAPREIFYVKSKEKSEFNGLALPIWSHNRAGKQRYWCNILRCIVEPIQWNKDHQKMMVVPLMTVQNLRLNQLEPAWTSLKQLKPAWTRLNQTEPAWTRLNQAEPVWSRLNQFKPVLTSWNQIEPFEPVWTSLNQVVVHIVHIFHIVIFLAYCSYCAFC